MAVMEFYSICIPEVRSARASFTLLKLKILLLQFGDVSKSSGWLPVPSCHTFSFPITQEWWEHELNFRVSLQRPYINLQLLKNTADSPPPTKAPAHMQHDRATEQLLFIPTAIHQNWSQT